MPTLPCVLNTYIYTFTFQAVAQPRWNDQAQTQPTLSGSWPILIIIVQLICFYVHSTLDAICITLYVHIMQQYIYVHIFALYVTHWIQISLLNSIALSRLRNFCKTSGIVSGVSLSVHRYTAWNVCIEHRGQFYWSEGEIEAD